MWSYYKAVWVLKCRQEGILLLIWTLWKLCMLQRWLFSGFNFFISLVSHHHVVTCSFVQSPIWAAALTFHYTEGHAESIKRSKKYKNILLKEMRNESYRTSSDSSVDEYAYSSSVEFLHALRGRYLLLLKPTIYKNTESLSRLLHHILEHMLYMRSWKGSFSELA